MSNNRLIPLLVSTVAKRNKKAFPLHNISDAENACKALKTRSCYCRNFKTRAYLFEIAQHIK